MSIYNTDEETVSVSTSLTHSEVRSTRKWGKNFDKDMNKLPETEWALIKDLETDHIKAIVDGGYCGLEYYVYFLAELAWREAEEWSDE